MKTETKEIELQKQIVEWLNLNGYFVWRANSGLAFFTDKYGNKRAFRAGFRGMADIVGYSPTGRGVAIEVKVGKNKLSDYQADFLYEVGKRQAIAFVAYSLEDVMARLQGI